MATLDGPRWGPREGKAQQLVVLVHGLGADGHDLIDLAPHWAPALPHAAFVAPDAPEAHDQGGFGRQWFSVADRTPARMLAGVTVAAEALGGFIDAELARLELPADAYALMGFSQGAMTALFTALHRHPPPYWEARPARPAEPRPVPSCRWLRREALLLLPPRLPLRLPWRSPLRLRLHRESSPSAPLPHAAI